MIQSFDTLPHIKSILITKYILACVQQPAPRDTKVNTFILYMYIRQHHMFSCDATWLTKQNSIGTSVLSVSVSNGVQ